MATINELYNHYKTLVGQVTYDKDELDTLFNGKVDKVDGKGLSTEDYTSAEKTKLAAIEAEANKTIVDASLIANSVNPVQSKVIQSALDDKVDKVSGKGLSTEDYTTTEKTKLAAIEEEANKTIVDSALSSTSENPVQNKVIQSSISDINTEVAKKANSADLHAVATSGSYADLENVPTTFTPSAHTQASSTITDTNTYSNLNNVAGTQESINSAIDSKIGALLSVEYQVIVQSLPTASASTMNKFYLLAEEDAETDDAYEIFITVKNGSTYTWEKVDTARIDLADYVKTDDARLSDARTPLAHAHGNLTNDGKIGSESNKLVVTGTGGVVTTSDMVTEMDTVIQALIAHGAE